MSLYKTSDSLTSLGTSVCSPHVSSIFSPSHLMGYQHWKIEAKKVRRTP
jgi:hypothetical protein